MPELHPLLGLMYFAAVLAGTLLFSQPVFLLLSLLCALGRLLRLRGRRVLPGAALLLLAALLYALWYGLYHHFGLTTLWENAIGNPITLEALACGLHRGLTAAAVLLWLLCLQASTSADRVVWLFGRLSPHLSLFFSILLGTLPRLRARSRQLRAARLGLGRSPSPLQRGREALTRWGVLLHWLAEDLIARADAMRSRGYTLPGRSAFSLYRFTDRDRLWLLALWACACPLLSGHLLGQTTLRFDPELALLPITPLSALFYAAWAALCLLPSLAEALRLRRFRRQRQAAELTSS